MSVSDTPDTTSLHDVPADLLEAGPGWLQVLAAGQIARFVAENAVGEVPGSNNMLPWRAPLPTVPMIVTGLNPDTTSPVRSWLARYYPEDLELQIRRAGKSGGEDVRMEPVRLQDLDAAVVADGVTLIVPPIGELENVRTFAGMMQLTRRLRGPGGCPWDREQSHATLKPYLLEEAYEVLDALDSDDPQLIAEEMGDLLYQITIHAQVAAEAGTFSIEDVIQNVMVKLIGRHPHVFGDPSGGGESPTLETAQDVRHAWESFKQRQKPKRASVLEEIPRGLPALPQSNLMQKRAASVGFAWPGLDEVVAKAAEELDELRAEVDGGGSKERQREELGDLLFALVGIARQLKIDPEEALRGANRKFAERFASLERGARDRGVELREMETDKMLELWGQAKA